MLVTIEEFPKQKAKLKAVGLSMYGGSLKYESTSESTKMKPNPYQVGFLALIPDHLNW